MIEIIVGHMQRRPPNPNGYWQTSVARPQPLGNPFRLTSEKYRQEVIDQYERYLRSHLASTVGVTKIKLALQELADHGQDTGGLILLCWCAPKACHGDVIARILREQYLPGEGR